MTAFELIFVLCVIAAAWIMWRGVCDATRLDALQDNGWQVGCIDGKFGVLAGSPPAMVGYMHSDVRKAIDAAVEQQEA